jgi:hypothetical protein
MENRKAKGIAACWRTSLLEKTGVRQMFQASDLEVKRTLQAEG